MEKIRDKLGDHLAIGDRLLFIQEPELQYTGQTRNIIQFVFTIEFFDDYRESAVEQTTKEIKVKEMVNKGYS